MVARPWSFSRLSCKERLPLSCNGNAGNSFPSTKGKDPSSRARRRNRGSSGCGRDSRASSRVETGMSGNFLSCSKGVKNRLEVQRLGVISLETPQRKWTSSRLEGRTSWIFASCDRCSRLSTGSLGTRSCGLRKGQSPCELLGGLSRFLWRRCRGLRPFVESVPEPEHSSPVMSCILGYFWSLPRGVSPRLEWGHARALSSRAVAAVSCFPMRGSRGMRLSLEAFPRGFPTGMSLVPLLCESILGLKVEAVQGKQFSQEWTETSGGLWEWWHDPGVPLAFPVERAST